MNIELTENEAQTIINALNFCSQGMDLTKAVEFNELARITQKIAVEQKKCQENHQED